MVGKYPAGSSTVLIGSMSVLSSRVPLVCKKVTNDFLLSVVRLLIICTNSWTANCGLLRSLNDPV